MKYPVCFFLVVSLFSASVLPQTPGKEGKRRTSPGETEKGTQTTKICRGVPIPDGYIIVAYEKSTACPTGTYVLQQESPAAQLPNAGSGGEVSFAPAASRRRKVGQMLLDSDLPGPVEISNAGQPELKTGDATSVEPPAKDLLPTSLEKTKEDELGPNDVVRIDTNLVTVPVSVLDRQGRFISDLRGEQFKVFENDVEQQVVHFEPTDKPFTVALMLDTSGSTIFHLSEIKEASIAFAKQLRPQDRVLVVTFDRLVMLLTEATGDLKVVTQVIERNAVTGFSTRLYDAIDIVITKRLNKIPGRKAIVLFTDGVDTGSYNASYKSTLREVDEKDILIYPVQYDTTDFMPVNQNTLTTVTKRNNTTPGDASQTIYSGPTTTLKIPGSFTPDYKLAGQFLQQLADKTGARLYQANDPRQLAVAFSRIAEDLRSQYSLGYYPKRELHAGESRSIKVRINQPDAAVKARDSYTRN